MVENLVAALRHDQVLASSRERDELTRLVAAMTLPQVCRQWLEDLKVISSLTPTQLPALASTLPERYAPESPSANTQT